MCSPAIRASARDNEFNNTWGGRQSLSPNVVMMHCRTTGRSVCLLYYIYVHLQIGQWQCAVLSLLCAWSRAAGLHHRKHRSDVFNRFVG